jgi:hypothetical protein
VYWSYNLTHRLAIDYSLQPTLFITNYFQDPFMQPLTRRFFMAASGSMAVTTTANNFTWVWTTPLEPQAGDVGPWYSKAWRRAVIDMHVPDWDPAFLAKFDPKRYAEMLVQSRAQSIYYSLESKFNMAGNRREVSNPDNSDTHTQAAMQVAARLRKLTILPTRGFPNVGRRFSKVLRLLSSGLA